MSVLVYILAGLGAGVGTGLAGLSAAVIISPMLIVFLGFDPYHAVGIALASDVLASAVSAITYGSKKNVDWKNGTVMLIPVIIFTIIGSLLASMVSSQSMGSFSILITIFLGLKFIIKPTQELPLKKDDSTQFKKYLKLVLCGIPIGLICGFIGAGGGMMMLLILTNVLGYDLKKAVGTSVFIMTFTALCGSVSHFYIGLMPDIEALIYCLIFTFIGAQVAARFANHASVKTQNRVTGIVLMVLGVAMFIIDKVKVV